MALQNQSNTAAGIHLETIYEESDGAFSSSAIDMNYSSLIFRATSPSNQVNYSTQGLISARSLPSVDEHRQRWKPTTSDGTENPSKPPIEVRFRDGSKHYIHSSANNTTPTTTAALKSRRKYSISSRHETNSNPKLANKHRATISSLPKKKKILPKKSEIILTIITAADLRQAGVTPPLTSSPDDSETVTLTKSLSSSSLDTIQTFNDQSINDSTEAPSFSFSENPVTNSAPSSKHSSTNHIYSNGVHSLIDQTRLPPKKPREPAIISTQNLPRKSTQSLSATKSHPNVPVAPPVAVVPPNLKKCAPSLEITLIDDENEREKLRPRHSSVPPKPVQSTKNSLPKQQKATFIDQPVNLSISHQSRSAFRPFKQLSRNSEQTRSLPTYPIRPQPNTNPLGFSFNPQLIASRQPTLQQKPLLLTTVNKIPTQKMNANQVKTNQNRINSDLFKMNLSDKRDHYSTEKKCKSSKIIPNIPIKIYNKPDDSSHQQKTSKCFIDETESLLVDPHLQWHSVTSKSLYDVPRLSSRYADIPLRITLPVTTPTHNQKLVTKHDPVLEKRLTDAGLSPETIALYERILEVADAQPTSTVSPPKIIDQYTLQSLV